MEVTEEVIDPKISSANLLEILQFKAKDCKDLYKEARYKKIFDYNHEKSKKGKRAQVYILNFNLIN